MVKNKNISISKNTFLLLVFFIMILLFSVLYFVNNYINTNIKKTSTENVIINTYTEKPTPIPEKEQIKKVYIETDNTSLDAPIYPKHLPQYNNANYQQVGILSANEINKEPIVLPLFGKKINGRSDRWNYYTATDKNNMMRLPVKFENKDCEDTIGCNQIYDKDILSIDIYKDKIFTATIYKNEVPQYFASPPPY